MAVSFAYALLLLLLIPYFAGYEPLGWFGMLAGIIGAWIVIAIAKSVESEREQDEEFLGTYVTEACHFEPWTERIRHEDEDSKEVTYEEIEHEEEWEVTVAEGDTFSIDEDEYEEYVSLFGNEDAEEADHELEAEGEVTDPGYCYTTTWPGTFATARYKYVTRIYKNPVLRSSNLYTSRILGKQDIAAFKLEKYSCKSLYGTAKGQDVQELDGDITDYNCWMRDKNIKLNFIVLENAESSKAMLWQEYWNNGKRNTINAVVGVDKNHKIIWAHVFGWQNEAACIKLRNFIMGQEVLSDITACFSQVLGILKEDYKLPDFKRYDFLRKQFPLGSTLFALTLGIGLFCWLFCRPPQYNYRAQNYLKQREYQLAKSNYLKYLASVPDDVYALNNLAVMYWRENNCEEAEKLFSRAIDNKNIYGGMRKDLYLNRGICYKDLKQNKDAISDLKQALEQDEYDRKSYCTLYGLYKDLGYKKSIRLLQKKYEDNVYGSRLKEDCTDHTDSMSYLYDYEDVFANRGIGHLLYWLFH